MKNCNKFYLFILTILFLSIGNIYGNDFVISNNFLSPKSSLITIKNILYKLNLSFHNSEIDKYVLYKRNLVLGDPLNHQEHLFLLKYFWRKNPFYLKQSKSIVLKNIMNKIIHNRKIFWKNNQISKWYDLLINPFEMTTVSLILNNIKFTQTEETLIWDFLEHSSPYLRQRKFNDDKPYMQEFKYLMQQIFQTFNEPINILDIGCNPQATVLEGIKNSYPKFISLAAGIDLKIKNQSNILDLKSGSIKKPLPWSDHQFDIIYELGVLSYFRIPETKEKVLINILKVLKPGGYFVTGLVDDGIEIILKNLNFQYDIIRKKDSLIKAFQIKSKNNLHPEKHSTCLTSA